MYILCIKMMWSLVGTNIFFVWTHYAFSCTHIFLSYQMQKFVRIINLFFSMHYLVISRPNLSNKFAVHRQMKQCDPSVSSLEQWFCSLRWWQLIAQCNLIKPRRAATSFNELSRSGNQYIKNTFQVMRNVPFIAKYVY